MWYVALCNNVADFRTLIKSDGPVHANQTKSAARCVVVGATPVRQSVTLAPVRWWRSFLSGDSTRHYSLPSTLDPKTPPKINQLLQCRHVASHAGSSCDHVITRVLDAVIQSMTLVRPPRQLMKHPVCQLPARVLRSRDQCAPLPLRCRVLVVYDP